MVPSSGTKPCRPTPVLPAYGRKSSIIAEEAASSADQARSQASASTPHCQSTTCGAGSAYGQARGNAGHFTAAIPAAARVNEIVGSHPLPDVFRSAEREHVAHAG